MTSFHIQGAESQFVTLKLEPGEAAIAEPGVLLYMAEGIRMDTQFGDGSAKHSGVLGSILGAGKRMISGEKLFVSIFINEASSPREIAFAASYPGHIVTLDLAKLGGSVICQKQAFLCAEHGIAVGIHFQKKLGVIFFGGEGFIMQKLEGDGLAFAHAGGGIVERQLGPGETLLVDTGCLVALTPSVSFDITVMRGVKNMLFGAEGLFLARLTGPGHVWLQSLPFSRMVNEVAGAILPMLPKVADKR
ncbi:MAG: TIGR00266 family protein [Alphaproteobacteria bacterium]|nr:TIGR00266 family protein [Alphaproteobacteria bacterium]